MDILFSIIVGAACAVLTILLVLLLIVSLYEFWVYFTHPKWDDETRELIARLLDQIVALKEENDKLKSNKQ